MGFDEWVFTSLVKFGAVKDYAVSAKPSRGRAPKGNLSIQITQISELRKSGNPNMRLWGLIGYAGLQGTGDFGRKMVSEVEGFAKEVDPKDPEAVVRAMRKAARAARAEFNKRYKENG